jgi:hypothetical protein
MPTKSFYLNDVERKMLFNFIKSNKGSLIPNLRYQERKYFAIQNSAEFIFQINKKRNISFFVLSDIYAKEPLVLRELDKEQYYISMRYGGPAIDMHFYLGFAESTNVKYKRTDISYYARYIHYNSYEEFPAPQELKDFFNDIIKFLNKMCKIVTINGRKYRVSKNVLKELDLE